MIFVSNFQSAISEGGDVDPGFYGASIFTWLAVFVVVVMAGGLAVQCNFDPEHKFDALTLGQSMGLVAGAYAALLLAAGGFRRLDRAAATTLRADIPANALPDAAAAALESLAGKSKRGKK